MLLITSYGVFAEIAIAVVVDEIDGNVDWQCIKAIVCIYMYKHHTSLCIGKKGV